MAAPPGFLDSLSWTSRSATPRTGEKAQGEWAPPLGLNQHVSDHRVNNRHRSNLRDYPEDCPPLSVRWFYAVDVRTSKLSDATDD